MKKIKTFGRVLKISGSSFIEDNAFKLSAALSYYTVFSIGPLLIMIISLTGLFFRNVDVRGKISSELTKLIGADAAVQIEEIIRNIQASEASSTGAIIGGIMLFIGATGVFTEMQDSINFIWSVRAKPKKGWLKFLTNRMLSFSLIVVMGFLLLTSLIMSALLELLSEQLTRLFSDYTVYLVYVINQAVVILVITGLFTVIFKVLPDAVISWKDAMVGAVFTAFLFLIGKFLISFYIGRANMGVTYGTAASIVVILSWVYYTSLILYFGAEFTKTFALQAGSGIRPKDTAVFVIKREAREVPAVSRITL